MSLTSYAAMTARRLSGKPASRGDRDSEQHPAQRQSNSWTYDNKKSKYISPPVPPVPETQARASASGQARLRPFGRSAHRGRSLLQLSGARGNPVQHRLERPRCFHPLRKPGLRERERPLRAAGRRIPDDGRTARSLHPARTRNHPHERHHQKRRHPVHAFGRASRPGRDLLPVQREQGRLPAGQSQGGPALDHDLLQQGAGRPGVRNRRQ